MYKSDCAVAFCADDKRTLLCSAVSHTEYSATFIQYATMTNCLQYLVRQPRAYSVTASEPRHRV